MLQRACGAFQVSDSGQPTDYSASKAGWRTQLVARRRALTAPARAAAALQLQAALGRLIADLPQPGANGPTPPLTVTGYVPFGAEPGGPDLPAALAHHLGRRARKGGRLLLPVLLPDLSLDWAAFEGRLVPGHRGPAEPAGARFGADAITQAALVVVPALAVDRRGVRLGRGGGSYDRALARVTPGTEVVALLYDEELVEELPTEPHDQHVTAALTPSSGLVRLPAPAARTQR